MAGMLNMGPLDRLAIGDWQESEANGRQAPCSGRSSISFMPVRYDGDRTTNALAVKGVCSLATSMALAAYRRTAQPYEGVPSLGSLRAFMPQLVTVQSIVNSRIGARATGPQPHVPPPKRSRAEKNSSVGVAVLVCNSSSSSSSASASCPSSSGSSCASSAATDSADRVAWLLPQGATAMLHIDAGAEDSMGHPRPACSRRGFRWGAEANVGLESAKQLAEDGAKLAGVVLLRIRVT